MDARPPSSPVPPSGSAPAPRSLAACAVGEVGRVGSVLEGGALRRRLMELGFVPGTIVRVVRRAPLRDPMEVELHGYHLSLRRSEALAVQIVPVSPAASPASAAP